MRAATPEPSWRGTLAVRWSSESAWVDGGDGAHDNGAAFEPERPGPGDRDDGAGIERGWLVDGRDGRRWRGARRRRRRRRRWASGGAARLPPSPRERAAVGIPDRAPAHRDRALLVVVRGALPQLRRCDRRPHAGRHVAARAVGPAG